MIIFARILLVGVCVIWCSENKLMGMQQVVAPVENSETDEDEVESRSSDETDYESENDDNNLQQVRSRQNSSQTNNSVPPLLFSTDRSTSLAELPPITPHIPPELHALPTGDSLVDFGDTSLPLVTPRADTPRSQLIQKFFYSNRVVLAAVGCLVCVAGAVVIKKMYGTDTSAITHETEDEEESESQNPNVA